MVLTAENYYSQEANEEYMSVSQFKDFCGTYGKMPCEFTAMEKLKGRWEEPKSKALMVGSYVDSYFEGTLDRFKAENPDLFKRDGTLKAEFVKADEIIQRIERDDYFMKFMSGKKQVIMTGELFGTKWKIKMDSYIPNIAIVDLKVIREKAEQITSVKETEMSELEAWAIVRKAIGRSNYYAEEEFEKLPEACKMAVGNPSNLREWAMMDSDQVGTVEQSHFVRNYRTAMQRIKEDRRMPEKVRTAIAEVKKQQMQIEARQEKPKLPVQEEKEDETQGEMSEETRRKLEELRGKIGSRRR